MGALLNMMAYMKALLLTLALLCTGSLHAAPPPDGWLTDYNAALAQAKAENKPVLVDFTGSDWCIWCMRLDKEVFAQPVFQSWAAQNVVLLKLDFPRSIEQSAEVKKTNAELASNYNVGGFPTLLILDADGKELARTGYRRGGAQAYVEHLKEIIR